MSLRFTATLLLLLFISRLSLLSESIIFITISWDSLHIFQNRARDLCQKWAICLVLHTVEYRSSSRRNKDAFCYLYYYYSTCKRWMKCIFKGSNSLVTKKNSLKMAFLVVLSHCLKINQKVAQVKIPPVDFDHFSRQQKNICFGVKIQMRHFGGKFLKLVMIVERIFSHEWVINYSFSPTRRGTQRPRKRTTSVVTKGFSVHFDPSPSSSILLQYITAGAECYTFTFLLAQFNDKWSSKFSTLLILLIFAPMSIFYSSIRTASKKWLFFKYVEGHFLYKMKLKKHGLFSKCDYKS